MAVVRIVDKPLNGNNDFPPLVGSGDQTNFISKFVRFMGFPFGNAIGKGFVEAVDFVFVLSLLSYNAFTNIKLLCVIFSLPVSKIAFQFPDQPSSNRL